MALAHWPLFDLRIRTPRLELRLPTDDDLGALATLAAAGIHDPQHMPFSVPWTDQPSPALERGVLQWGWRRRAALTSERWTLPFVVVRDDQPVGVQDLSADSFAVLWQVGTGSWLGRAHQGHGIGREMRAAVLHLAFAELGAERALSGAFADNPASRAVSRALGYVENGRKLHVRRGEPAEIIELLLDRVTWEAHRRDDIAVSGLGPCLPLLGIG